MPWPFLALQIFNYLRYFNHAQIFIEFKMRVDEIKSDVTNCQFYDILIQSKNDTKFEVWTNFTISEKKIFFNDVIENHHVFFLVVKVTGLC